MLKTSIFYLFQNILYSLPPRVFKSRESPEFVMTFLNMSIVKLVSGRNEFKPSDRGNVFFDKGILPTKV